MLPLFVVYYIYYIKNRVFFDESMSDLILVDSDGEFEEDIVLNN